MIEPKPQFITFEEVKRLFPQQSEEWVQRETDELNRIFGEPF